MSAVAFRGCALQAKKRRGGRRLRKMKERYGLTDVSACKGMFNCKPNRMRVSLVRV
jgi:hypothetical protein